MTRGANGSHRGGNRQDENRNRAPQVRQAVRAAAKLVDSENLNGTTLSKDTPLDINAPFLLEKHSTGLQPSTFLQNSVANAIELSSSISDLAAKLAYEMQFNGASKVQALQYLDQSEQYASLLAAIQAVEPSTTLKPMPVTTNLCLFARDETNSAEAPPEHEPCKAEINVLDAHAGLGDKPHFFFNGNYSVTAFDFGHRKAKEAKKQAIQARLKNQGKSVQLIVGEVEFVGHYDVIFRMNAPYPVQSTCDVFLEVKPHGPTLAGVQCATLVSSADGEKIYRTSYIEEGGNAVHIPLPTDGRVQHFHEIRAIQNTPVTIQVPNTPPAQVFDEAQAARGKIHSVADLGFHGQIARITEKVNGLLTAVFLRKGNVYIRSQGTNLQIGTYQGPASMAFEVEVNDDTSLIYVLRCTEINTVPSSYFCLEQLDANCAELARATGWLIPAVVTTLRHDIEGYVVHTQGAGSSQYYVKNTYTHDLDRATHSQLYPRKAEEQLASTVRARRRGSRKNNHPMICEYDNTGKHLFCRPNKHKSDPLELVLAHRKPLPITCVNFVLNNFEEFYLDVHGTPNLTADTAVKTINRDDYILRMTNQPNIHACTQELKALIDYSLDIVADYSPPLVLTLSNEFKVLMYNFSPAEAAAYIEGQTEQLLSIDKQPFEKRQQLKHKLGILSELASTAATGRTPVTSHELTVKATVDHAEEIRHYEASLFNYNRVDKVIELRTSMVSVDPGILHLDTISFKLSDALQSAVSLAGDSYLLTKLTIHGSKVTYHSRTRVTDIRPTNVLCAQPNIKATADTYFCTNSSLTSEVSAYLSSINTAVTQAGIYDAGELGVQGAGDVLSNFNMEPIKIWDRVFKSPEHAYAWAKNIHMKRLDVADKVLMQQTSLAAKRTGRLPSDLIDEWDKVSQDVMVDILSARLQQSDRFRTILLKTGNRKLLHTVRCKRWGIGATSLQATHRPGKNWFGLALMEVRKLIRPDYETNIFSLLAQGDLPEMDQDGWVPKQTLIARNVDLQPIKAVYDFGTLYEDTPTHVRLKFLHNASSKYVINIDGVPQVYPTQLFVGGLDKTQGSPLMRHHKYPHLFTSREQCRYLNNTAHAVDVNKLKQFQVRFKQVAFGVFVVNPRDWTNPMNFVMMD